MVGLPREFWVLWAGTLVNRIGTFSGPFLVLYVTQERGMSVATAGLLITLQGAGMLLSNVLGGSLADRFPRRHVIGAGLLSSSAVMLLLATASSTVVLGCAVVLLGLTGDIHRPGLNALIADLIPEAGRVRAYSLLHWAVNLGLPVAGVLGGLAGERHLPILLVLDAASTAVFAVLVLRATSTPTVDAAREIRKDEPAEPTRSPWRDPVLALFVLANCGVFAVYFQNYTTLPLAVVGNGLDVRDYGFAIACNGIVVAVCQPLLVTVLERRSQSMVLAVSYALTCGGFALTAVADTLPLLLGTVLLWSLGEIGFASVGPAFVTRVAPQPSRARYQGVYGAGIGIAAVVAPLAGTGLLRIDPVLPWLACAGVGVLAVTLQLLLIRPVRLRAATTTTLTSDAVS